MSNKTAYLSFLGFEEELAKELAHANIRVTKTCGRLFLTETFNQNIIWAQDIWQNYQLLEIASVGDAVKKLKSYGNRWCGFHQDNFRRAELIQEQVFKHRSKPIEYLQYEQNEIFQTPTTEWMAWSLIEKNLILCSQKTKSFVPLNKIEFVEDKINPPSRAYLKLWEVFTVHGQRPKKNEIVVDFGSCPGGWTWVLANLGCQVISIDKAKIDDRLLKRSEVRFLKKDAFTLKPKDIGKIDWFFSDIICYPKDLYELIQEWLNSGLCQKFVCTIKFQGETDFEYTDKFLQIPNSQVVHLSANKHEVTWIKT